MVPERFESLEWGMFPMVALFVVYVKTQRKRGRKVSMGSSNCLMI